MPDTITEADLERLLSLGVLRLEPISIRTIEDIEDVLHAAIYSLGGQLRAISARSCCGASTTHTCC
ncbi:hypothetical protein [Nocardia noduli]|uniref:hypothetical protein n=1 Tax=Nocardia noduli TaxID=2815722 RepID=UPI001C24C97D|nr:hypothetical protein [Nocardia noduli]